MKAVILAGGRGRRLAPFTVAFPKPLVPVGERAVLEILIRRLVAAGFDEIVLSVDHLAELLMAYVEGHPELRSLARYRFARDREPGGTAGPLARIDGLDDETFLVANGDLLTTLDFADLIAHHRREGAALTVAVHQKRVKLQLGVLDVKDGRVTRYTEKPEMTYDVSMGVYVYEPRARALIQPGERLDFPDLCARLLERGEHIAAYRTDAYWLDIGNPDDYARAQEDAARGIGPAAEFAS